MRASLCIVLAATCVLASGTSDTKERGSKLPYVADAVGNALPRPSSLPATVGSPVNLLTPDRYEFYTFDESGELVKRLMTLEEIQAIVAAGEEAEGLVTFANDNQPTIAFNFSQPPYTKVHNVVTNVQNVLKAQMEAHKNKPHFQPTLDTPDVSDSWSLILPSIFGNTGVDIGPDKIQNSGTFTTPETETIDLDNSNLSVDDNSLSKEGNNDIIGSSTTVLDEDFKAVPVTEKTPTSIKDIEIEPTTSATTTTTKLTTTTTYKPITTSTPKSTTTSTTSQKPASKTTSRPILSSSTTTKTKPVTEGTFKKNITTGSTEKSNIKTTVRPRPSTTSTTNRPRITTTTVRPRSTTTTTPRTYLSSTTVQPRISSTTDTNQPLLITITSTVQPSITTTSTTIKPRITTTKIISTKSTTPISSTSSAATLITKPDLTIQKSTINPLPNTHLEDLYSEVTSEKSSVLFEKISTFVPVSTVAYINERTTQKAITTSKLPESITSTTKRSTTTMKTLATSTSKIVSSKLETKPSTSNSIYVSSTQKPSQEDDSYKMNVTTLTTQSVSPSTTVSSTEFLSGENIGTYHHLTENTSYNENNNNNEPMIPLFDVAQSISQIASDLGSNYIPIPTTNNLLDTTKFNGINLERKENFEIDIPTESQNETDMKTSNITDNGENFVKISTLDPHGQNNLNLTVDEDLTQPKETTTESKLTTTIDPILSESMGDLLSQVVNQAPQAIITSDKSSNDKTHTATTNDNISIKTTETPNYTTTANILSLEQEKETLNKSEEFTLNPIEENIKEETNFNSKNETKTDSFENKNNTINSIKQNVTNSSEDFVQISISRDKNNTNSIHSQSESNIKPLDNGVLSNETSVLISENNNNKEISTASIEITTYLPLTKIESTTKMSNTAVTQSTLALPPKNKFDTGDSSNRLNIKNDKIKIPEFLPKIDDFKKKIQKVNIDDKEFAAERNNSWKLISTVSPPKINDISKDTVKHNSHQDINNNKDIVLDFSKENQGLEVTTKDLGDDIAQFTELCNELAFRYWNTMIENIDKRRSFVLSPYSITSMLAMMFMGARGATSGEMNEILKLDDMVTFNPHFTLKNISDSIETSSEAGVVASAFIRELYSDRNKGKILRFYKERAQQFYNGHVEEIDFNLIGDKIRRRTNLLVKRYTWGKISEYIKTNTITMQPPLAAYSANIFETDCSGSSVDGRDGEMYFVVSPNVRQRRLVPVPAVVYRSGFLAGYDPVLDATAAALGNTNSIVSTLFLMPGQQGNVVHSEDLEELEQRMLDANPSTPAWNRLLRTLLPRMGLELQIPRFSHKSVFNVSSTLKMMGLKDIFDAEHADLGGLNGPSKDLYLSDMIQSTTFVTCGEGVIADQHHIEEYPDTLDVQARRRKSRWAADWDEPRDYQRAFHDPHDVGDAMHLPLHLRPRQARLPSRNTQPARLKFDRPFLYFVRHNPTGMILYVGRYNPRLLP